MLEVIGSIIGGLESLFGGKVDPGHWENGVFIPGDLNNRLATAQKKFQLAGVSGLVDQERLKAIIYVESGWQASLDAYIAELVNKKNTNIGLGVTNELNKITQLAGFTFSPFVWLVGLAGLVLYFFNKKNKRRFF